MTFVQIHVMYDVSQCGYMAIKILSNTFQAKLKLLVLNKGVFFGLRAQYEIKL